MYPIVINVSSISYRMKVIKSFLRKVVNLVKDGIEFCLRKMPLAFLAGVKDCKLAQRAYLYKYGIQYQYGSPANLKFCVCSKGDYEYDFFNMCFLNNMMGVIISSLSKGYAPIINVKYAGVNIWEMFLKQPFSEFSDNHSRLDTIEENVKSILSPSFRSIYRKDELAFWCKFYQDFVKLNDGTSKYIEDECADVFVNGRRVLGVLCRGTDYVTLRPLGHPVQPTLEQVFSLVETKMVELNIDYIYLATEEKSIKEQFDKKFPGKVLVNKRTYYDDYYKNKCTYIREVDFKRENDNYYKGLEYLSSIVILSRCNALIGGNTGGSCAAMFMNNMNYEYSCLFDLGCYD